MSTLYSPEQIAQHVIERRMGSATAEDLEALAYGYQRINNHYEQAKAERDSARAEVEELRKRVESAEALLRAGTFGDDVIDRLIVHRSRYPQKVK